MLWIIFFDEATKKMVSKWIKKIIKKATDSWRKTLWIGFLATIILQWSSAVLLILESFVSVGMMEFSHAARVIMWCNIWSSAIGVILWSLWLEFDLASYALPLMWVLAFLLLILKSDRSKNILKIAIWLCLIFVWLWYMNDGMAFVADTVDFVKLSTYPVIVFYFVWLFATIIMQSSAITIALTLSAASVGLVDYRMWIMLLLWCFLWTTSTAVLGCIKWWYLKKQVAATQVTFNAILSVIWIATLPALVRCMQKITSDIVLGLSVFALLFKAVAVTIMLPFLSKFTWLIEKWFPKKETNFNLHIQNVSPKIVDAGFLALDNDLESLLRRVLKHSLNTRDIDEKKVLAEDFDSYNLKKYEVVYDKEKLREMYDEIKEIWQILWVYAFKLKANTTKKADAEQVAEYYDILSKFISATKYMKDVHSTIEKIQDSDNVFLKTVYKEFVIILIELYRNIIDIMENWLTNEAIANIENRWLRIWSIVNEQSLQQYINENSAKMESTILPNILHTSRYFYLSCSSLVSGFAHLYQIEGLSINEHLDED